MALDWYFTQDGSPRGPVTEERLERMVRSGLVDAGALIWHLGMREWQPVTARFAGVPRAAPFMMRSAEGMASRRVPAKPCASRPLATAACALGCPLLIGLLIELFYQLGLHAGESVNPRTPALMQIGVALVLSIVLFGSTVFAFSVTPRPALRMFSLFYSVAGACVLALVSVFAPPSLRIAAASSAMNDYRIVADDGTASLRFGGRIGPGSAYRLQRALDAHPKIHKIVIDSPGGLIEQARRAADLVERRHLTVVVHEECSSACLIVLMASPHRLADAGAVVGLHSPSQVATVNPYFAAQGRDSADSYFQYLQAHGLSERFLGMARSTPANDVTLVDCVDLVDAGILEGIYFRGRTFSLTDANWRSIAPLFKHT